MAVRDDLTCQEARLDSLELREDIFVSSVDTVAPAELLLNISELTTKSLLPAVDSGDAKRALDVIDASLARVLDASENTSNRTLDALLAIARSQSIIRDDELVRLIDQVLQDPEMRLACALAGLATEHDGVDYVSHSALDLASRLLSASQHPQNALGSRSVRSRPLSFGKTPQHWLQWVKRSGLPMLTSMGTPVGSPAVKFSALHRPRRRRSYRHRQL